MRIFVLKDVRADQWLTPFCSRTNGTAFRELSMSLRNADSGNVVAQHPDDFELWVLGDFDEKKGALVEIIPVMLGSVKDCDQS